MDESLATWLQLREPADAAARSTGLTRAVADILADRDPLRVIDLATGTGSNVRYLAPHLPRCQQWLVVDRDPALLALVPVLTASWGAARHYHIVTSRDRCVVRGERLACEIETRQADLGRLDDEEMFAGRALVTASALLDLASESWLMTLVAHCRAAGAAALFALTYNGWSSCSPAEPEDDMIRELLNRHQTRDKGLSGPAEGPHAAASVARCFSDAGYQVRSEPSNWTLGPIERELQRSLIDGWCKAALQMAPGAASTIAAWRMRRIGHLDANRSHIVVGHVDAVAWSST